MNLPSQLALGVAAVSELLAILWPGAGRWGWAVAALGLAACTALDGALIAGGLVAAGVVAATALDGGETPAASGFNTRLAGIAVIVGGAVGSLVIVVRVLGVDPVQAPWLVGWLVMGIAAMSHLTLAGPPEFARCARLVLVLTACGWALLGHPASAPALLAAGCLVAIAGASRVGATA